MRRGGLIDAGIVLGILVLAAGSTPVGALGVWGIDALRGVDRPMPQLVGFFSFSTRSHLTAAVLLPVHAPSDSPLPGALEVAVERVVRASGPPQHYSTPEAAVEGLRQSWHDDHDLALERWALGRDVVERAASRARSAGSSGPTHWVELRRWLPAHAVAEGDRLVQGPRALATVLELAWPIQAPHHVTSGYGWRTHPTLGTKRFHNGIDLGVPIGTTVFAAQSGRIAVVGENAVSGRFVVIDHEHDVRTAYCHLDQANVTTGEHVERGAPIGASGNTGRSTGPHLHFMVRLAGETLDPHPLRPEDDQTSPGALHGPPVP